jgi:hypothetical protein
MPLHTYVVNSLIEFPVNGSTARGTRNGHIDTQLPASADGLRGAIASHVAAEFGVEPDQVTFVEFTFTEIPTA